MPAFDTQRLHCRPLSLAEYATFATGVEPEWLDLANPHRHLKVLRYTVSPDNAPSLHIIKKLEFHHLGEQFDEEDGVELIYELDSKTFQNKFGGDERI